MPRIGRYPFFCKSFFRRARKIIGSSSFAHFWRVVIALASMQGRRSLSQFETLAKNRRSRQAISHFLTQAEWDAPELLRGHALEMLKKLGFRAGERLYVVLDDTQNQKFGKRMDAVVKIFLHAQKRYAYGHTVLGCALVYRNVVIPYAVDLWTPKDFADRPFRKLTVMAGEMISALALPPAARPIVLFDAYYLCPAVTGACATRKLRYISAAKRNRCFAPDGRPRDSRKLFTYGCNLLAREGQVELVDGKHFRLARRIGTLRKAGRVSLVFNRRVRESAWRVLVTNHLCFSARTVLGHYLIRWQIELLFKAVKQHLGFGDYQLLRYTGVVRYLHLVLIAYLLLTHLALAVPDAQANLQDTKPLALPSIVRLQSDLRTKLWHDAINSMECSSKYRAAARKLKDHIML